MNDDIQPVQWIVATLAPWTISPHPNFSQSSIEMPARLALVAERRFARESQRYGIDGSDADRLSAESQLIRQADASLFAGSQASATRELWGLVDDSRIDDGVRAAAALFASVGSSEMEQASFAAARLERLTDELARGDSPQDVSPSRRLILAALTQQRVARLIDARQLGAAREAVAAVLLWVPPEDAVGYEVFSVSQGISWDSQTVQQDMAASMRAHAFASRARLESIDGRTWQQVVRSRRGWLDMRMASLTAERDALVLRDRFESAYESTSGTRYLMRTSAASAGYASLLIADLAGHTVRIRQERESLGKILLLETKDDAERVREAIRLLRQSGASAPLQSALNWIRHQGPTEALILDSETILGRSEAQGWTTLEDLQVFQAAAAFMTSDMRRRAIGASLRVLNTEHLGRYATWSLEEKVWRAIADLVPESGADDLVVNDMTNLIGRPAQIAQPLANALARVVDAIDWNSIGASITNQWIEWANATAREVDTKDLRELVLDRLAPGRTLPDDSMARAAFLADAPPDSPRSDALVTESSDYLIKALADLAETAKRGVYSFGGYQPANVAVAFAMRYSDIDVWQAVVRLLVDRGVDGVLKEDALDRMARFSELVPTTVTAQIRDRARDLLESSREDHLFSTRPTPVFSQALRLLSALRAIDADLAMASTMQLAAGGDVAKIEAAKTVPFALGLADAVWGHALLLQLSRDGNPLVRAEAAGSLVLSLQFTSPLTELTRQRLIELLRSDGLRVPLIILIAIERLEEKAPGAYEFMRSEIDRLANDQSTPSPVKRAAKAAQRL